MNVIVLGAGIIGVSTAYYLNARGYQVTVIDRQAGCARECSFANGGQLSYSHVEPWASPYVLSMLPKWVVDPESPLSFSRLPNRPMITWIARFLARCRQSKVRQSSEDLWSLACLSQQNMDELLQAHPYKFHQSKKGTMHIFDCSKRFASAVKQAQFQQELGCKHELLMGFEACMEKEPALSGSRRSIVGGIYYPNDAAGDAHIFTKNLEAMCCNNGVRFVYDKSVSSLVAEGYDVKAVRAGEELFEADVFVVALGAYSPKVLEPMGISLPIYPIKGHSVSLALSDPSLAPAVNITDQSNKIVFSRLANQLRIAGLAEFAGYNDAVTSPKSAQLKKQMCNIFPQLESVEDMTTWSCLRPSTPDSIPIIGRTPYKNLYLNTGHGALGWTLALGSGSIIASLLEGEKLNVNMHSLRFDRW